MPDDRIARAEPADARVARMALRGLLAQPKTLPPTLFYDEAGCALFYQITRLPEYYLTRTELALLDEIAPQVAASVTAPAALIEYGASSEAKAARLLDRTDAAGGAIFPTYVPIDVAETALLAMADRLATARPALRVLPVVADFLQPVQLPPALDRLSRLGFFPGSTIGNLDPAQARQFLAQARRTLGQGARMLVGVDLRKDAALLIPAYDDAAGVTAAFNLNILRRLNREAGADFDLGGFAHRAVWNDAEGRIEMHLVSLRPQTAHLAGHTIRFGPGETIHTENSYKHTPDGFRAIARAAGWRAERMWTDAAGLFSLHLLSG
ncbi:MAG TPA: L-histidine N(alpha)-methyltransferase [Acetobacteraceae bacterium]|nr:L-histidine N(alpha)-methyltransferase [Acetobacteraceae bacterium]